MRLMRAARSVLLFAVLWAVWSPAANAEPKPSPSPEPSPGVSATQVSDDPEVGLPPAPEAPGETPSESAKLSLAADVTFASKYLFQGIDYSDGRSVLQPDVVTTAGPFSLVAWGNFQPDLGDLNEIDLSVKVSGSIQKLSVSPGYTYLRYPNRIGWDPSQELFVDLGLEGSFHPALSLHYDVDAGDGLYATLGLSHALKDPVTAGVNLYYQAHYYEMTGVPSVELKMSGSWSYQGVSLSPSISRFLAWENDDFRHEMANHSTWLFSLNVARTVF
jgi:hypothetical protein